MVVLFRGMALVPKLAFGVVFLWGRKGKGEFILKGGYWGVLHLT